MNFLLVVINYFYVQIICSFGVWVNETGFGIDVG